MMISGNAAALNSSGQNDNVKMKHNNSNQSIPTQKKIGISTIRKPGAGSLDNSFTHSVNNGTKN